MSLWGKAIERYRMYQRRKEFLKLFAEDEEVREKARFERRQKEVVAALQERADSTRWAIEGDDGFEYMIPRLRIVEESIEEAKKATTCDQLWEIWKIWVRRDQEAATVPWWENL